jgi:hypothetical protein
MVYTVQWREYSTAVSGLSNLAYRITTVALRQNTSASRRLHEFLLDLRSTTSVL